MKTGAVIAASGVPQNMPDFDPTIMAGDTSIIKKIVITLQRTGVEPIAVVTGHKADLVEKNISNMGVVFLRNDNYRQRDMFHAVCMGLDYLKNECDKVFVIPADIPLVSTTSLDLLLGGKGSAVCPIFNGKPGHPLLLSKEIFEDVLNYKGDNGLWGAVTSGGHEVEYVDVDDEGVLFELDSRKNLDRLQQVASLKREPLRCSVQLKIGRNELVFGPGILQFLELVGRSGSMQTACRLMHISYSKGLKMISLAEKETGLALLERHAGGSDGGVSFLTDEGRAFINNYIRMKDELERSAGRLFQRYFKEYADK